MPSEEDTITMPIDHVSVTLAAKILGVTSRTMRRWIRDGTVKAWRLPGKHARIPRAEIEKILRTSGTDVTKAHIH